MTNKRDLKAYVRYDGSGRVIAGSLVLRRKKPKVGQWHEVQGYECCNDVTLKFTVPDPAINDVSLVIKCNGTQIHYGFTPRDSTNMSTLLSILNSTFNLLGVFSNPSGNIIQLVISGEMKTALCPVGTLSFEVVPD